MAVFSMLTAYEKIGRFNVDNLWGIPYLNHMLRRARIDAPGALHHLVIRGIEGKAIFKRTDREDFIERLSSLLQVTVTP